MLAHGILSAFDGSSRAGRLRTGVYGYLLARRNSGNVAEELNGIATTRTPQPARARAKGTWVAS
jgi:hypothetical protein